MSLGNNLDDDSIPLADDDPQVIITENDTDNNNGRHRGHTLPQGRSMDSLPSTYTNGSSSPGPSSSHGLMLDTDIQPDEQEEKARLISQVLELQNTLDDLSQRVNSVKEENLKLKSENSVLNQYVENLMSASSVFQSAAVNSTKKK